MKLVHEEVFKLFHEEFTKSAHKSAREVAYRVPHWEVSKLCHVGVPRWPTAGRFPRSTTRGGLKLPHEEVFRVPHEEVAKLIHVEISKDTYKVFVGFHKEVFAINEVWAVARVTRFVAVNMC